jgi:hypothetical protein
LRQTQCGQEDPPAITASDSTRTLQRAWLALCILGAGCSSAPGLLAVPQALQQQAVVPSMPRVRYRAPDFAALTRDLQVTVQRERAQLKAAGYEGALPSMSFLALSGGGADAAFDAGCWSAGRSAATGPSSTSSPASVPAH